MLAQIGFDYSAREAFKALTEEQWNHVRVTLNQPEQPYSKREDAAYYMAESHLIDLETEGAELLAYGIQFTIKRFRGAYWPQGKPKPGVTVNYQVALPNIGLLAFNEVQVLENACTDDLQEWLDKGWRIIAVCPPNNARRPDYVLGRTKP